MDGIPHNDDGTGGMHLYTPWWLDNKKLDFPARLSHRAERRPAHAERRLRQRHPRLRDQRPGRASAGVSAATASS
jgi:hypothetical protein